MKISDIIKTSQTNLVRAKLRTALTIIAVVVGTFTISITNGVSNGVNAYVNKQLGNVGVDNAFVVQAKSLNQSPVSTSVDEYDPNRKMGNFDTAALTSRDISNITEVKNVTKVIPNYPAQIDYITAFGQKKYIAQ